MTVQRVVQGDLFKSGAQTLVNTVNVVGVMGKGIALGFKQRFPAMFEDYRQRCARNEVRLGEPYIYKAAGEPWVINFPTKGHWRSPSKLADIERGLDFLAAHAAEWGIQSLAVPPLGCGNGELEWRVVGPIIFERLSRLEVPVLMYAPFDTTLVELEPTYLQRQLSLLDDNTPPPEFKVRPAMVALVAVMARLERSALAPAIGRTTFQKLGYFASVAGLPLGVEFRRGAYGPYSDGMKDITKRLMNNSLISEEPYGAMTRVRVGPAFDRAEGNFDEDLSKWSREIDRLVDLFSRMGTNEAEIAATIHYAANELLAKQDGVATELDVYRYVDEWKPSKFDQDTIATAIRNLGLLEWLSVRPSRTLPLPETAAAVGV